MYTRMPVSKPMKLITLRIAEEEKARLEQLAQRGNVTLSRALREGAALYLADARAKVHRARGGDATFHGIRRDASGRPQGKKSPPTEIEVQRLEGMRRHLYELGFFALRESWERGCNPSVVAAAIAHWLSLVGHVYVSNGDEVGWDWFLRDYCGYSTPESSKAVRRGIRSALIGPFELDVPLLLDTLDAGFQRFLRDATHLEPVRRAVLPTWAILEEGL
jgi:hypothetical protein